jgi:hypothetical protein
MQGFGYARSAPLGVTFSEPKPSGDGNEEEDEDEEEGEITPYPHSLPPEDLPSLGDLFS